jgi:glycosyltransferase involved in cell wall biosynthesis
MRSSSQVPLITVIVPVHNGERYLGEALQSLLSQTFEDIEVIVVDDGSSDRSPTIAAQFVERDRRFHLIVLPTPSGQPAQPRNTGIAAAKGTYIAFLDADDVALPNRFESVVAALRMTKAQLIFADMLRMEPDAERPNATPILGGRGFPRAAHEYVDAFAPSLYICRSTFPAFMISNYEAIHVPTVVCLRELLADEPFVFDEGLVCGEDLDLFYRLARRTQPVFVEAVHSIVRVHRASLTASRPDQSATDGLTVRTKHYEELHPELTSIEASRAKQRLARAHWELGYARWCEGRNASARASFALSFRLRPSLIAAASYLKAWLPRARLVGSTPNS